MLVNVAVVVLVVRTNYRSHTSTVQLIVPSCSEDESSNPHSPEGYLLAVIG